MPERAPSFESPYYCPRAGKRKVNRPAGAETFLWVCSYVRLRAVKGACMEREAGNYGVQREHEPWPAPYGPTGGMMGAREEGTWSALGHLSTFLNAFTGFLGPVAAFLVLLAHRDKSPTGRSEEHTSEL